MISCEKSPVEIENMQVQEKIDAFTASPVFVEFSKNFPEEHKLINFKNVRHNQTTPDVETIHLPIEHNGKLIGQVVGLLTLRLSL